MALKRPTWEDGQLIVRRNGPLESLPDMINASEYVDDMMTALDEHCAEVFDHLKKGTANRA